MEALAIKKCVPKTDNLSIMHNTVKAGYMNDL